MLIWEAKGGFPDNAGAKVHNNYITADRKGHKNTKKGKKNHYLGVIRQKTMQNASCGQIYGPAVFTVHDSTDAAECCLLVMLRIVGNLACLIPIYAHIHGVELDKRDSQEITYRRKNGFLSYKERLFL